MSAIPSTVDSPGTSCKHFPRLLDRSSIPTARARSIHRSAHRSTQSHRAYTRGVDEQALDALELSTVLERLAAATATPYGAERARSLRPAVDADDVARRQTLTAEGIALLDNAAEPALHGIRDVRTPARRA